MALVFDYLWRVLIGLDQLGNALLGGRPDHTISGRVGYASKIGKWWGRPAEIFIDTLFWFDPDHCQKAIEYDEVNKPLAKFPWGKK